MIHPVAPLFKARRQSRRDLREAEEGMGSGEDGSEVQKEALLRF